MGNNLFWFMSGTFGKMRSSSFSCYGRPFGEAASIFYIEWGNKET